jgi:hypothetical protein
MDGTDVADLAARVILDDLPCRSCGYNLRGLSKASGPEGPGRCPECDTPIDRSLRGDLLGSSDPHWLRTVVRGLRLLQLVILPGLVSVLVTTLEGRLLRVVWLAPAIVLVIGAVGLVGVWFTTEREPAVIGREHPMSARRLLRVTAIGAVLLAALSDWLTTRWPAHTISIRLGVAAMCLAAGVCSFRYAISLARRIRNADLLSETRAIMWGLIISYGLVLGLGALAMSSAALSPALSMVFGLSCTVIIACFVFTLWTPALIGRFAAALEGAAYEAAMLSELAASRAGHAPE